MKAFRRRFELVSFLHLPGSQFWGENNKANISYVKIFYEGVFLHPPNFFHRLYFYEKVRIFALKDSTALCHNTEIEKRWCLLLTMFARFIATKKPISSNFSHLFCYVAFSCSLQTFLSRSVAWVFFSTASSYTGSGGFINIVGGPLSKVSNGIPFLTKKANFHCCVQLFHERVDVLVAFSQMASMWREVLSESTADCAILFLFTSYLSIESLSYINCVNWTFALRLPNFRNWL